MSASVQAKWVYRNGLRWVRVTATSGAVTTEATLTEDEAREMLGQLSALLGES